MTAVKPVTPSSDAVPLWLRVASRTPWTLLYGFARFVTWLMHRVFRSRLDVVRANLAGAFPSLDPRERARIEKRYFRFLGELVVEAIKAATITPDELRARVQLKSLDVVKAELDAGRSVLIIAAHQCNWEWMLLAMSLELGHPMDAAYKPLKGKQGERIMRAIRTRFGGRLIPAKEMLADIIAKRGQVRAVAMVADQEPVTTDYKWWTTFMDRETAFYMGPEKIARATRFAVIFAGMRHIARGRYEVSFEKISEAREIFEAGAITERYVRLVEREIRANPSDWIWSHRRWRLQKDADDAEPAKRAATS